MTSEFSIYVPEVSGQLAANDHWKPVSVENLKHLGTVAFAQSAQRAKTLAEERVAFIRLALTQRRESWRYRNWAIEARAAGNTLDYHRHAATARRLWRDAKTHLSFARSRNPL